MKALLRKDFHVNRLVLGVGLGVLLLPYASWTLILLGSWQQFCPSQRMTWLGFILLWCRELPQVALWSLILSILTISLLAGNAVAGERADRSAEFLASLPVSRWRSILSKIALAFGTATLFWLVNLGVIGYRLVSPSQDIYSMHDFRLEVKWDEAMVATLSACLVFGVAWFCSTCLASPAIAAGAGIGAPVILFMTLGLIAKFSGVGNWTHALNLAYVLVSVLVALAGFVAGTINYLRRCEP